MRLNKILSALEQLAPQSFQEGYDNSGLIVGSKEAEVNKVIFCLDSTEDVVDEAIKKGAELIVAHHPIVFSGLKSLTGKNYIERTILKAIKNDIAIYAIHTNLDNVSNGVNRELASRIGLEETQILSPKGELMKKIVFFCPIADAEKVRTAIFDAGAGHIGAYDCCAFQLEGEGSFRAGDSANPHVGKKGEIHFEKELRIETVVPNHLENQVVQAMIAAHPYEEVAYDLYDLEMPWNSIGSGMWGKLPQPMKSTDFLSMLKKKLNVSCIRHTKLIKDKVETVALCGGSGSFLLNASKAVKADVFVTADFKYHQFFDAEEDIIIADVGHYESEQFTPHLLSRYLKEKFNELECSITKVNTNPVKYF
jgi:dinuclear metal center YbgI/SA1388 family protein